MPTHTEGCLICGKPLVYHEEMRQLPCQGCGATHTTNATCEDGHFICDACHAEPGLALIAHHIHATKSKDPCAIATELMTTPSINMHGPEHHYLVPASLLAAYKNAGGAIDLDKAWSAIRQRAKNVPGGICGMWGSCGAAIGTGIFISVLTGASPLSDAEWSLANRMTAKSLTAIAANGGPRCCKRNTYLAITQAVDLVKEHFAIAMEHSPIACRFAHRNKECRKEKCLYYRIK